MRFLRLLVAALVVLGPALLASSAHAQVVTPGNPEWSARRDDDSDLQLNQINQADCLAADVSINFGVDITGAMSNQLFQVWSGTNCAEKTSRQGDNKECTLVAEGDAESGDVAVLVKDILQTPSEGAGIGTGTDDTCRLESSASGTTPRSLFFLVVDPGDGSSKGTPGKWDYTFDLIAPDPPTEVKAGPGENSLTLEFTQSEDDDLDRYRFYCAPADGADGSCSSSMLVPGELPAAGVTACGSTSTTAKTSGETNDNLTNGVTYAVAIAATDKLGNVGVLSSVACGVPQEVTGYFEAYRAAGGQAGGGFCSFAPARRGVLPMAAALVLGLAAFARRRR